MPNNTDIEQRIHSLEICIFTGVIASVLIWASVKYTGTGLIA